MNPNLDYIFTRRSVRKFTKKKLPEDLINDLMEAAMAAPSAVNKKPYEFLIIDKSSVLKEIADYLPNGQFLPEASMGIVVCGDISKAHNREIGYLLQDCSASIENILLSSYSIGLCTCWLGVYPNEDRIKGLKKIFSLPENIIPVSVIAVGYSDDPFPAARTQYDTNKIHRNSW